MCFACVNELPPAGFVQGSRSEDDQRTPDEDKANPLTEKNLLVEEE